MYNNFIFVSLFLFIPLHGMNKKTSPKKRRRQQPTTIKYVNPQELNAQDEYGQTLLHKAVENKDYPTITQLLELDADTTIQDNEGNTPINTHALTTRLVELYNLHKKEIKTHNHRGETPLLKLAISRTHEKKIALATMLQKNGYSTKDTTIHNETLLHEVSLIPGYHNSQKFAEWCIKNGVPLNEKDTLFGRTPLDVAYDNKPTGDDPEFKNATVFIKYLEEQGCVCSTL